MNLRQKWLPAMVLFFVVGSVVLFFALDAAIGPGEQSTDERRPPVITFEDAVLVGRRDGVPQWELRGSHMVTDNDDLVIGELHELLLLQTTGVPYRVLSTSGRWNAQDGVLVLPQATSIERDADLRVEAGSFRWRRSDGMTILEDGVRLFQNRTVVASRSAHFQPDSGWYTMFGSTEISWTEGDESL